MTLSSTSERVIAVDVARRMLELVRAESLSHDGDNVELVQADVRHLPFRAGVADFVLNLEVLEHLQGAVNDVRAAFEEFQGIFGPLGALITEARLTRCRVRERIAG